MNRTLSKNLTRAVVTSYVTTAQIALAGSILGLGIVSISPAQAATFTYSGDTTGKPTWNRSDSGNPPTTISSFATATRYDVFSFTVDTAGSYIFDSSSPYDNYGLLYQGSFDPASPLTNVIIGNDDNFTTSYNFTTNLSTGTNYFLVSTGFNNTDFGAFTTTIDGPGNVSAGGATAVPEPFTIVGTLVGGTAAMRMRKKLKAIDRGSID
jgi:hypothetical protein